jgi:hypothetical protein
MNIKTNPKPVMLSGKRKTTRIGSGNETGFALLGLLPRPQSLLLCSSLLFILFHGFTHSASAPGIVAQSSSEPLVLAFPYLLQLGKARFHKSQGLVFHNSVPTVVTDAPAIGKPCFLWLCLQFRWHPTCCAWRLFSQNQHLSPHGGTCCSCLVGI